MSTSVVVVGDGWSALGAVGFHVLAGSSVYWVTGTRTRLMAPLACLETGPGVDLWARLLGGLGIESGSAVEGDWVREFKNKSFRKPAWENRELWKPERRWVGVSNSRFQKPVEELSDEVRQTLMSERFAHIKRIDGLSVTGFKAQDGRLRGVVLDSGEEILCEQAFYADRWSLLSALEGLPKPLPFLAKRDPHGVLQLILSHLEPVGMGVSESFFAPLHRESGEGMERHAWGYFSADGKRSLWSLCLTHDEVENNHEIGKKLRRLKSSVDKAFSTSGWLPPDKKNFSEIWVDEQVRLSEEAVFAGGESVSHARSLPDLEGLFFLTDAYGPSRAFQQLEPLLENANA